MAASAPTDSHPLPALLRSHLDVLVQHRRGIPLCYRHDEPFGCVAEPMQTDSFREYVPLSSFFLGVNLFMANIRLYLDQQLNKQARGDGFRHASTVYFTDLHLRETDAVLAFRVNTQLVPVYVRREPRASRSK